MPLNYNFFYIPLQLVVGLIVGVVFPPLVPSVIQFRGNEEPSETSEMSTRMSIAPKVSSHFLCMVVDKVNIELIFEIIKSAHK